MSDVAKIVSGFNDAISTIKNWHGDVAWDIYFRSSPEMTRIREAQALAQRLEAALPAVVERLQVIERMDPESQFASVELCKRIASEALSLLQAEKKI